jgi:hypothetical protein
MKRLAIVGAIFAVALTSCGGSESIAVETTETSATVSYGTDCNTEDHERILGLATNYLEAKDFKASTKSAYLNEIQELRSALISYRSSVRRLDLPTLIDQQMLVVDEIETFLAALNRYISSDGEDTSYLDASIPMTDALQDFTLSYFELCAKLTPQP